MSICEHWQKRIQQSKRNAWILGDEFTLERTKSSKASLSGSGRKSRVQQLSGPEKSHESVGDKTPPTKASKRKRKLKSDEEKVKPTQI
eukprot:TRINITY_DN926_c0_g1_i1.p2 TRINITY_DN926_c0_g1~~TRINITY_DN926_c0_g1_i1.p2  ORF type:complete len:88 (-),score=22.55 TRINITY_DN926_c0_g1_i1:151-414(-)